MFKNRRPAFLAAVIFCGTLAATTIGVSQPRAVLTGGAGSAVLLGQAGGNNGGRGGSDAGAGGTGGASSGGSFAGSSGSGGGGAAVAPAAVAGLLTRGAGLCSRVPEEYLTDCISALFQEAASLTPQFGAYADAHRVLSDTAARLDRLVSANLDSEKPSIRLRTGGGGSSPRLSAVRPQAVAQVNAEAAKIVAEAETILLRSPAAGAETKQEYARIAEAVGSNKLLLRS